MSAFFTAFPPSPYGVPGGVQTTGYGSVTYGDPGISSGVPNSSDWVTALFDFGKLGATTYLADQAINSSKGSTITQTPNGLVVSGGGATPNLGVGGGFTWSSLLQNPLVLIVLVFVLIMLFRR